MENFIYSMNATLPVFLVIIIGYYLKKKNILNDNFVVVSNGFNFNVTLPALLFQDIARVNIMEVFDLEYLFFCMSVTIVSIICIWWITKKVMKDQSMVGAFVQGSFRGSAAVLGLAFIQNMYGNSGMVPIMIIGAVPLYNMFSVIVLTMEGKNEGENNIKNTLVNICKNPMIISILAGVVASIFGFYELCPPIITKTINNFAVIATPLALVTIGCGFEGRKALAKWKPTMIASFIKLILLPTIFLPIAVKMGFRDEKLIAILIMLGAPSTVSCYIMAKNMNNDGVLTSSIIVMTTLLSSITLTFWIYVLKILGLI